MAVATELLYRNYDSSDATFFTAYSNELFPTIENVGWAAQAGHIFKEWNTSRDGTGASFDPGDSFPSPASYTTFYAIWEEYEEYDVAISYKGSSIATMSASGTKTLETEGKYCEDDITITYTKPAAPTPTLQTKSVTYTPSTSHQTASITADAGYDALGEVIVNVNAMPSGTAGTPTATKGTVSSNSVSVTPSVTNTTGYITGGTKTGTPVTVSASELVSGTKTITSAGTTNVTNYESASVASGSATTPATTITANPTISVSSGGLITASVSASQSVTPTVSAGYVSSGTAGTVSVSGSNTSQLTTQAAQTIHPSTTDQTIASQRFLTGTQTVKGVLLTNLSAENIKKDVVVKVGDSTDDDCVTSVTGTYEGSGGGALAAPMKDVNFIDYDGTIVYSYTAQEFAALSAMPANPSHNGLTAQGWNWTLADAKTYVASYGKLWIGQMYITESGDTEIDIQLHAPRLSPYLGIAINGTVEVDWGDGTAKSTVTGTSLSTQIRTLHNYSAEGSYTIKIHKVSGSYALYGTTACSILNGNLSSDSYNRVYANSVQRIRIGNSIATISYQAFQYLCSLVSITIPNNITTIGEQAFKHCTSLKSVTIPSGGVTSISNYLFNYCTSLKSVSMPSNITNIGGNAFSYCYSLESVTTPSNVPSFNNAFSYCYSLASITIPSNLTYLYTYAFYYCYSLASITIESNVTTIQAYAFAYCCGLGSIHFKSSTPPTVLKSTAWSNVPTDCIIYVPTGSLSNYTGASNYPSSSTYTYVEE